MITLRRGCVKLEEWLSEETMSREQWKLVVPRERNDCNDFFFRESGSVLANLKRRIKISFHSGNGNLNA